LLKRLVLTLLVLLALLLAALAINTVRQGSRQAVVQPLPVLPVDEVAAAASLAAAVQARTVSGPAEGTGATEAFEALHAQLAQRYPRLHAALRREGVGAHALVYTWPGSDPTLAPIALLAHQDVVPIAPGTEAQWAQPPFGGVVADGFVWGRGTWDDKGNLIAQLEAVEALLADGFQPRRTVYLIYGDDEEVGGLQGAAQVAALLRARGVTLDWVLDEGLVVTEGILPGAEMPVALVGIAEKGYVSVQLKAEATGGHSSMPPAAGDSAIGMLAAALARLDAHPMPSRLNGVARQMFDTLAPEMGLLQRVALSNLWLSGPVLERMLARGPATNALLRTTAAPTVFHAGNKDNVLPGGAEAVVNFRLLPGDTSEDVFVHVKRVIADERIQVTVTGAVSPASPISSADAAGYAHIAQSVREVFPGSVVAPGLMLGGTDARHFQGIARDIYRFTPVRARPEDLARFHGSNERIALSNLAEMIRFYHRLVQRAAS